MTLLIADGTRVLADSKTLVGDLVANTQKPKIEISKDGKAVLGVCGVLAYSDPLFRWYNEDDCDPDKIPQHLSDPDWQFIVFKSDGAYYYHKELLYPDYYPYPCAFGSGAHPAFLALCCNVPIDQIMSAACENLSSVGGPVTELAIPQTQTHVTKKPKPTKEPCTYDPERPKPKTPKS